MSKVYLMFNVSDEWQPYWIIISKDIPIFLQKKLNLLDFQLSLMKFFWHKGYFLFLWSNMHWLVKP